MTNHSNREIIPKNSVERLTFYWTLKIWQCSARVNASARLINSPSTIIQAIRCAAPRVCAAEAKPHRHLCRARPSSCRAVENSSSTCLISLSLESESGEYAAVRIRNRTVDNRSCCLSLQFRCVHSPKAQKSDSAGDSSACATSKQATRSPACLCEAVAAPKGCKTSSNTLTRLYQIR